MRAEVVDERLLGRPLQRHDDLRLGIEVVLHGRCRLFDLRVDEYLQYVAVTRDEILESARQHAQHVEERFALVESRDGFGQNAAQRIAQRTLPFGLVADHDQFVGRTLRVDALFAQRAERLAAETRRCDGKHDGQFYYSFHRFYTFLCEERADAGAGDRPVQTEIRSLQKMVQVPHGVGCDPHDRPRRRLHAGFRPCKDSIFLSTFARSLSS